MALFGGRFVMAPTHCHLFLHSLELSTCVRACMRDLSRSGLCTYPAGLRLTSLQVKIALWWPVAPVQPRGRIIAANYKAEFMFYLRLQKLNIESSPFPSLPFPLLPFPPLPLPSLVLVPYFLPSLSLSLFPPPTRKQTEVNWKNKLKRWENMEKIEL